MVRCLGQHAVDISHSNAARVTNMEIPNIHLDPEGIALQPLYHVPGRAGRKMADASRFDLAVRRPSCVELTPQMCGKMEWHLDHSENQTQQTETNNSMGVNSINFTYPKEQY